jgi:hypothetical protein
MWCWLEGFLIYPLVSIDTTYGLISQQHQPLIKWKE